MRALLMSSPSRTVTLRVASEADRFLVARWLGAEHVAGWFGSRAAADASLALARSSPSSLSRMVLVDGVPAGYGQATPADPVGDLAALPAGSYRLDAFIGDAALRGQGHGATALGLLRDEVFTTTFAPAVAVVVALRNEAAVRRIERAGFRWHAVLADPLLGPCWLLVAERP